MIIDPEKFALACVSNLTSAHAETKLDHYIDCYKVAENHNLEIKKEAGNKLNEQILNDDFGF